MNTIEAKQNEVHVGALQGFDAVCTAAREAVKMYDRYCLHDMTIDEADLGEKLEALAVVLGMREVES